METLKSGRAMTARAIRALALIGVLLLGAAACGGGGGDGGGGGGGTGGGGSGGGGGGGGGGPTSPPPAPPPFVGLSSEAGSAQVYALEAAFMGNGDGVAVWEAETSAREVLRYAVYTAATDSWGADTELAVTEGDTTINYAVAEGDDSVGVIFQSDRKVFVTVYANGQFGTPQLLDEIARDDGWLGGVAIASNGRGYAAAWRHDQRYDETLGYSPRDLRASVLADGAGSFSAASELASGINLREHRIASNGDSYVVSLRTRDELQISYYAGAAWQPQPMTIDDGLQNADDESALVTNGDSYLLAWPGANDDVRALELPANFAPASPVTLDSGQRMASVRAALRGSDYVVAWERFGTTELATSIGAAASFTAPAAVDVGDRPVYGDFRLAARDQQHAVAWRARVDNPPPDTASYRLFASIFDGAWANPATIDAGFAGYLSDVGVAPTADGFAVIWSQSPSTTEYRPDLWSNVFESAGWTGPGQIDSGALGVRRSKLVASGERPLALWSQQNDSDDFTDVTVRAYDGGWGTETDLSEDRVGAGVNFGNLYSNGAGDALAVWSQYFGTRSATFASIRPAGADWGAPVEIDGQGVWNGGVAASDDGFALAYSTQDNADTDVYVQLWEAGSWQSPVRIDESLTGYVQTISAVAGNDGYLVAWVQQPDRDSDQQAWGSVGDGSAFSPPVMLSDPTLEAQSVEVASNGTHYAVTWDTIGDGEYVNVYDGSDWSGTTPIQPGSNSQSFPKLMSDGSGFLLYWSQMNRRDPNDPNDNDEFRNIYVSRSASGAAADFGPPERLTDDTRDLGLREAASDGTGYVLAIDEYTNDSTNLYTIRFDGSDWSGVEALENWDGDALLYALEGNAGSYAATWFEYDEDTGAGTLYASVDDGSGWAPPAALESLDTDIRGAYDNLAAAGDGYATVFRQTDPADGEDAVYRLRLAVYDGGAWSTRTLETFDSDALGAKIAAAGDDYALWWTQPDPDGDPIVWLPWAWDDVLATSD